MGAERPLVRCGRMWFLAVAVWLLCFVWVTPPASAVPAGGGSSDQFHTSITLPSASALPVPAVPGVQIAVHNALSVSVNGHELTNDRDDVGGDSQKRRYQPHLERQQQRVDDGGGAEEERLESEAQMRRLVSSTIGSAMAASYADEWRQQLPTALVVHSASPAPPSLAPAASTPIPLTLVDEHNSVIAHGMFQPNQDTLPAPPASVTSAAARDRGETDAGMDRQDALSRLAALIAARLAQRADTVASTGGRVPSAAADSSVNAGGVEIALTDSEGRVVGSGTYFPHQPAPSAVRPGAQQEQQQRAAPSPTPTPPATHTATPQQFAKPRPIVECYDDAYDSRYCQHVQHDEWAPVNNKRRHRLVDTQLVPASSPNYSAGDEATVERSRLQQLYPTQPRMVVIEPQSTLLYSQADITQSLAPSLAAFPPVAPFLARPRPAAAELAKQAAQAAAPTPGTIGEAGEEGAAELGGPGVLGTEFRNQA